MRRALPACGLAALLLAAGAPAQEKGASGAGGWVEYGRSYAEVKSYKLLARRPGEAADVLARFVCMTDHEEHNGCALALEIYRKLSLLILGGRVTFNHKPKEEGEAGRVNERITRYAIDCGRKRYLPVFTEWRDARGNRLTRIDYGKGDWRDLYKIEDLAASFCK